MLCLSLLYWCRYEIITNNTCVFFNEYLLGYSLTTTHQADVELAVAAARRAFSLGRWTSHSSQQWFHQLLQILQNLSQTLSTFFWLCHQKCWSQRLADYGPDTILIHYINFFSSNFFYILQNLSKTLLKHFVSSGTKNIDLSAWRTMDASARGQLLNRQQYFSITLTISWVLVVFMVKT